MLHEHRHGLELGDLDQVFGHCPALAGLLSGVLAQQTKSESVKDRPNRFDITYLSSNLIDCYRTFDNGTAFGLPAVSHPKVNNVLFDVSRCSNILQLAVDRPLA